MGNENHENGDGGGRDRGGFDDDSDDFSDATIVEDFPKDIVAQFATRICTVAIDIGRHGNGLGDLVQRIDGTGDVGERARVLTSVHAHGCNVARCLRDALEAVTAANELLGKAASRARFQAEMNK